MSGELATRRRIDCGRRLEVADVRDLQQELSSALDSDCDLTIDTSAIERVDAAALQLLCAFIRKAELFRKSVDWGTPSESFVRSARLMGVEQYLNI